jgi:hypothetical protein
MNTIDDFTLGSILSRFTDEDVVQCVQVCKRWNGILAFSKEKIRISLLYSYTNLDLIKWTEDVCKLNYDSMCNKFAKYGNLTGLMWARENNRPWNRITCSLAARNGHLNVLN